MAPLSSLDITIGLVAIAVAALAVYLFMRASSSGSSKTPRDEHVSIFVDETVFTPRRRSTASRSNEYQLPKLQRHMASSDVESARSQIRTLTLKRELLSMVLKRLFEAEDDGEVTREERVRLSGGYETELKSLSDDLKQAELVVSLHELESIRDDILKKFEETLNSTQTRIDTILKELKIEEEKEPALPPRRRRAPERREEPPEEEEEAEEEADEEEAPRARRPRSDVEEKLEQLRMEVLKELEELEKLELEV
ncbi:MAG: hypothetical protein JSV27_10020 [Candidatus Bathyarchaeota archaeon]|nr:MAG: hypothetical protein JSV27_10020 [Candidatus Bathyarchaeota archaeon]